MTGSFSKDPIAIDTGVNRIVVNIAMGTEGLSVMMQLISSCSRTLGILANKPESRAGYLIPTKF